MSTVSIDNSRNTEKLSAFMSKIVEQDPVDNYFTKNQTLDFLYPKARKGKWGRQSMWPVVTDENSTFQWFGGYDTFSLNAQNAAVTATVPMKNAGCSLVTSWEDLVETAADDVKIFDRLKFIRENGLRTTRKKLNAAFFTATPGAKEPESLPNLIDSTGTAHGLSASTYSGWASTETASGSFASQGLDDMRSTFRSIMDKGGDPKVLVTTSAIYGYYESYSDIDVTYDTVGGALNRGWKSAMFNGVPLIFDGDCTSGVIYFIDTDTLFLAIDSDGDFKVTDFRQPTDSESQAARLIARLALVMTKRNGQGKMTGVTA